VNVEAPVNVFRVPDGFLVALTCGRNSEWVKNVLAAGGAELETANGSVTGDVRGGQLTRRTLVR
jgi:hypothetical protein